MSQELRKILSENLKNLRIKYRINKEDLSVILGFDNSYISKLENCRINITLDKLEKIANYFDIPPHQLLK